MLRSAHLPAGRSDRKLDHLEAPDWHLLSGGDHYLLYVLRYRVRVYPHIHSRAVHVLAILKSSVGRFISNHQTDTYFLAVIVTCYGTGYVSPPPHSLTAHVLAILKSGVYWFNVQ